VPTRGPSCSSTRRPRPAPCGSTWPESDVYYFAPQKALASDGGLWLAVCSPAAVERIGRIAGAAAGSRRRSTSPPRSTTAARTRPTTPRRWPRSILLDEQLRWLNAHGGLEWAATRCEISAAALYGWAEDRSWATPFVGDPAMRSTVVGTIDLDESIPAPTVSQVLRANGVLDTDSYRKLGRNQIRIGMFPAVDPTDVAALTACVDHIVDRL
jgi:phosphoserine aminotransferase